MRAPNDGSGLPPARKSLGQHFLTDRRVLERIVAALQLTGGETVVEVGPGRGALTDLLAQRATRLVAIELDRALIPILRERYAAAPHVSIVEGDVLEVSLGELAGGPYVLAGNVPYYITTPILFHALRTPRPRRAVFLVQREVADRVGAAPGGKTYGALSVNVQALARATVAAHVPAAAFRPRPKVDSAVLAVSPLETPLVTPEEERPFQLFVLAAFGQRRKQLRRVLRTVRSLSADEAERVLEVCGLDPAQRPETLSPADFATLFRAARTVGREGAPVTPPSRSAPDS